MTPVVSLPTWAANVYILLYLCYLMIKCAVSYCPMINYSTYRAIIVIDIVPVINVITMVYRSYTGVISSSSIYHLSPPDTGLTWS